MSNTYSSFGKWIAGVAAAIITGIIIWWLTSPGGLLSKREDKLSLNGIWKYSMTSYLSGQTYQGALRLTMSGSEVSGILEGTFDKTSSGVWGQFANNTLDLNRETEKDKTLQIYRLTRQSDNKFTGTFWNRGPWKDTGAFQIMR